MKVKMYVITHKKFDCPKIACYYPIQVGAENNHNDLGYLKDNTKDNISSKNANYCELTGLYWIWKNDNESDIIGISHYRRYFTTKFNRLIDEDEIKRLLSKYDVIVPKKEIYGVNAFKQYCQSSGLKEDLEKVEGIIKDKYPEYEKSFKEIMKNNKMYQYNMLITTKVLFDSYSKWLFDILFELEKSVDLEKYNDYQKRIFGFISERLINVWLHKNNFKLKELNVINTESTFKEKLRIKCRRKLNYFRYRLDKEKYEY